MVSSLNKFDLDGVIPAKVLLGGSVLRRTGIQSVNLPSKDLDSRLRHSGMTFDSSLSPSSFKINPVDLDFDLPENRIAQEPLLERDQARLMVVNRSDGSLLHKRFGDLLSVLKAGDVLVLNEAKVNHAKLIGRKLTGGKVEIILIAPTTNQNEWRCLVRPEIKPGTSISLPFGTRATLVRRTELGENILKFEGNSPAHLMEGMGHLPLPPYIKRAEGDPRIRIDEEFYQTVYATQPGSLAAPTAGLHFSKALLKDLQQSGVEICEILLNVGWGTFKPISKSLALHQMLPESYEVGEDVRNKLMKARDEKRRIIAVGTTVTRVLESFAPADGHTPLRGETNLFIKPGFSFQWLSGLITNFHVPRSTPVSLTAAFCGLPLLEKSYEEALRASYRFFSYGDAMLIL